MNIFLSSVLLCIGVVLGVYSVIGLELATEGSKALPEAVTVQAITPTDDQLLEFWFGSGDKAALRKRICK